MKLSKEYFFLARNSKETINTQKGLYIKLTECESMMKKYALEHLKELTKQIENSHSYGFEDELEKYIEENFS